MSPEHAASTMRACLLYAGAWDARVGVTYNAEHVAFYWECEVNGDHAHGYIYREALDGPETAIRAALRSEAIHAVRSCR